MDMARRAGVPRERAHLLINRNYGLLWSGRAVSIAGDFVFNAGLVVWIGLLLGRGHAWAPLAVSGVMVAATLPVVVVGPVAGVLADRWDKRRTMLWTDAIRLGLMVAFVLLLMRTGLPLALLLGAVYVCTFLANTLDQLFRLSMVSLIPSIVPEPERPRALGLGQAAASLAMIVGPPIAAPLVLTFGIRWALLINALSFLVSYLAICAVDSPADTIAPIEVRQSEFTGQLFAGIRFLIATRALVTLMLASVIAMVGGAALNTLDVFFVTHNLHTPGSWYGLLDAVFGVGAVLGAVLAGSIMERVGAARTIWCSLLLLGALVLVYARLTAFAPAASLLFICGVPMAALQVSAGTLVMQVTPREMMARISSLLDPVTVLAMLLGTALAGYLDGAVLQGFHARLLGFSLGPVDTIFTGSGVLILLGGLAAAHGFRLRRVPATEEAAPAA